jgi:adenosine deaminase
MRTAARRRILLPLGACALSLLSLVPAAAQTEAAQTAAAQNGAARPGTAAERRVAVYLDSIKDDPAAQRAFFAALPKGGDLHNHLSGAASTEYILGLAAQDGMCLDPTTTAYMPPCKPGDRPAADTRTDADYRRTVIAAWSMQDFPPGESGHDHFFDAFNKFGDVTWRHRGELLADVTNTLAAQNQSYLETMISPASEEAKALATKVGWDDDFAKMHAKLLADGQMDAVVAAARKESDDADAVYAKTAHCGTAAPDPGCEVAVRWISQVSRGSTPERVFTQMVVGMRLAEQDARFVAVNLVQPEDWDSSLQNYRLQMRMLNYLHTVYPKAHITLHAGELVPGLVKPEDLTFHVDQAVRTGEAERIGHGVDLRHETNWQDLARTMAAQKVAVEVPFTSNAQILGVKGADHPFSSYRQYGVPIVLATDDPGISRVDITHEYQYAAQTYGLSYPELKDLARASLEYAFVPGASLFSGPGRSAVVTACRADRPGDPAPHQRCAQFLAANPKAALQWQQEGAFTAFERQYGGRG